MNAVPLTNPKPRVTVIIDGAEVTTPEGSTILTACHGEGIEIPTLCYLGVLPTGDRGYVNRHR